MTNRVSASRANSQIRPSGSEMAPFCDHPRSRRTVAVATSAKWVRFAESPRANRSHRAMGSLLHLPKSQHRAQIAQSIPFAPRQRGRREMGSFRRIAPSDRSHRAMASFFHLPKSQRRAQIAQSIPFAPRQRARRESGSFRRNRACDRSRREMASILHPTKSPPSAQKCTTLPIRPKAQQARNDFLFTSQEPHPGAQICTTPPIRPPPTTI
jgi:hypothetical protein